MKKLTLTSLIVSFLVVGCSPTPDSATPDSDNSRLMAACFDAGVLCAQYSFMQWANSYLTNGQAPPFFTLTSEEWEKRARDNALIMYSTNTFQFTSGGGMK